LVFFFEKKLNVSERDKNITPVLSVI